MGCSMQRPEWVATANDLVASIQARAVQDFGTAPSLLLSLCVAGYRVGNYLPLWRMYGCSRFFGSACPGSD